MSISDKDAALILIAESKSYGTQLPLKVERVQNCTKTSKYLHAASVNKNYLRGAIRSIESHNRREEIDECWRHHELSKKAISNSDQDRKFPPPTSISSFASSSFLSSSPSTFSSSSGNRGGNGDELIRENWAKRKALNMTAAGTKDTVFEQLVEEGHGEEDSNKLSKRNDDISKSIQLADSKEEKHIHKKRKKLKKERKHKKDDKRNEKKRKKKYKTNDSP